MRGWVSISACVCGKTLGGEAGQMSHCGKPGMDEGIWLPVKTSVWMFFHQEGKAVWSSPAKERARTPAGRRGGRVL